MNPRQIKVALVEDNEQVLRSLRDVLAGAGGIEVVGGFASAEEFLPAFKKLDVDIVLMDINLPGQSGIDCIRDAKTLKPDAQFMVLTVFESPAYVFQALCAGATGYLVKGRASDELVDAIRDLNAGGSPMSSAIARLVVGSFQKEAQQRILDDQLTEREKSLLDQLANGLLYKEIAAKWGISIETVRKHARNIYAKLHVGTRTEAIRKVYPDR
jgi:DNA-binding NarL/FixJ family response regulator